MKKKVHLIKVRMTLTSPLHYQKKNVQVPKEREGWHLDRPSPHPSPLAVFPFLSQLVINLQILDVELEMEVPNLLLAQVKALTKIFGINLFHHLLEVI